MTFQELTPDGLYAVWGKENLTADKKENSYVFEKDKPIEMLVVDVKDSSKYGLVFEFKIKGIDEPVIAPATTNLLTGMGYKRVEDKKGNVSVEPIVDKPVEATDKIRLTYLGKVPTRRGKEAYTFKIEVDR